MHGALSRTIVRLATLLLLTGSPLTHTSGAAPEESRPSHNEEGKPRFTPETVRGQMRWKLEETPNDLGFPLPLETVLAASPKELERLLQPEGDPERHRTGLHRTVEALIQQGNEPALQRAREILAKLVEIHDRGDFRSVVTTHGVEFAGFGRRQESGGKIYEVTEPNRQRPTVLNFRELAYEHAMLFLLTGDEAHALRARDLLLRFAEVAGKWPLYDRRNQPHAQDSPTYLANGTANGLWGVWHPLDMRASLPLLRAYDIVRPVLTPEQQRKVEEDFFVHQKELIDRIPRHRELYTNLQGYRLPPLILFGRVLERPAYVHEAVAYLERLLHYSYTADGFWKEVTPGYHRQITSRLTGACPLVARGYSDPPGYRDPVDGTRFDNLDLRQRFGVLYERMNEALSVLAMPDGTLVSLNDAWPKKDKVSPEDSSAPDVPGLLGVAGLAKLGGNGMVAFLSFGGLRGHDHDAPLGLTWFAGGREVFSETGYQALPGSDSSRKWHTISASHHTVTVDESMNHRAPERLPERLTVPMTGTPEADGKPLTAVLPAAAQYANQGRLLVWHAEGNGSAPQAMEAEREAAYPQATSLYRRTLVMIPGNNGDGLLVDIFRIRGGRTHDFALRGGLDEAYTMSFNTPLHPADGTLYDYVQVRESAPIRPPLLATVRYGDGYEVRSRLGAVFGSPEARLQLIVGEAPAIRRLGKASFSYLRHQLPEGGAGLETCYVWVHEAGKESTVNSVRAEADGGNVLVVIERKKGTERIFSGMDETSRFETGGWNFTGRLAMARTTDGAEEGTVFSGGSMEKEGKIVAKARPPLAGTVIAATRRDAAGTGADTLLVKLDGENRLEPDKLLPRLVHLDFGPHLRFSIPVKTAHEEEGRLRLELAHSPGFDLTEGKAVMTHSPGWAYAGTPTVRIDFTER